MLAVDATCELLAVVVDEANTELLTVLLALRAEDGVMLGEAPTKFDAAADRVALDEVVL